MHDDGVHLAERVVGQAEPQEGGLGGDRDLDVVGQLEAVGGLPPLVGEEAQGQHLGPLALLVVQQRPVHDPLGQQVAPLGAEALVEQVTAAATALGLEQHGQTLARRASGRGVAPSGPSRAPRSGTTDRGLETRRETVTSPGRGARIGRGLRSGHGRGVGAAGPVPTGRSTHRAEGQVAGQLGSGGHAGRPGAGRARPPGLPHPGARRRPARGPLLRGSAGAGPRGAGRGALAGRRVPRRGALVRSSRGAAGRLAALPGGGARCGDRRVEVGLHLHGRLAGPRRGPRGQGPLAGHAAPPAARRPGRCSTRGWGSCRSTRPPWTPGCWTTTPCWTPWHRSGPRGWWWGCRPAGRTRPAPSGGPWPSSGTGVRCSPRCSRRGTCSSRRPARRWPRPTTPGWG